MERKAADLEMLRLATHRWLAQHAANNVQRMTAVAPCQWDAVAVCCRSRCRVALARGDHTAMDAGFPLRGLWQQLALLGDDGALLLQRRQLFSPAAFGRCRP